MAPRSRRWTSSSTSSLSHGPDGRPGAAAAPAPSASASLPAWSAGPSPSGSSARPRRNSGTSSSFDGLGGRLACTIVAPPAGGPEAALGSHRVGQLVNRYELRLFDPLDHQLRDAVPAAQRNRRVLV